MASHFRFSPQGSSRLLPDDSEGDNSQQHGGGTSGSVEEQP